MVKVIAGLMGSSVASGSKTLAGSDQLRRLFDMLTRHGIRELDTARVYNHGKSEEDIGNALDASSTFIIETKAPGFSPGSLRYQNVIDNCNASLRALKRDRIDLYYFHGPDSQTPLEESCRAINQLHVDGKISRFGVSNLSADQVQQISEICNSRGWLKPSVYQGGYNPLFRTGEQTLFPVLRKLGIAFYAFSPLGGGFFSRPVDELRKPPPGSRFDQMKVFSTLYVNDVSLELHGQLTKACDLEQISVKEATLRWLMHHSALGENDGVILGAASREQMEENVVVCERGPLPESIVMAFEEMWRGWVAAGKALPAWP